MCVGIKVEEPLTDRNQLVCEKPSDSQCDTVKQKRRYFLSYFVFKVVKFCMIKGTTRKEKKRRKMPLETEERKKVTTLRYMNTAEQI